MGKEKDGLRRRASRCDRGRSLPGLAPGDFVECARDILDVFLEERIGCGIECYWKFTEVTKPNLTLSKQNRIEKNKNEKESSIAFVLCCADSNMFMVE